MRGKVGRLLQKLDQAHYYWKVGYLGIATAGVIHLFFLFLFLYLDVPTLAAVNVVSVLIYWYSLYGLGIEAIESGDDSTIGWLIYLELIGHNLLAAWTLGREAGFQFYLYIPAFVPFFIVNYSRRLYLLRTIVIILLALLVESSPIFDAPKVPIDPAAISLVHYINLMIFLVTLSVLNYLYAVHERSYHSHLQDNSLKDPLTGLSNRRHVEELVHYIDAQGLYGPSCGVVLVDIDRFKSINDTLGHSCGDRIIIAVAELLRRYLPSDVTVARWGGDEFLLFFQETDAQTLKETIEKLRKAVEESQIRCAHDLLDVRITLGATQVRDNESFEETLHRADEALYRGKEAGRNQAVFL